MGKYDSI